MENDQRREVRIVMRIPVTIEGRDHDGNSFLEETTTLNVSSSGACIATGNRISAGSILKISSSRLNFKSEAEVRLIWQDKDEGFLRIGVEFIDSNDNWILR
jgi:hypothetical protein